MRIGEPKSAHRGNSFSKTRQRCGVRTVVLAGMLCLAVPFHPDTQPAPGRGWSWTPPVLEIRLTLNSTSVSGLERHPRQDVPATIQVDTHRASNARVHLKGRSGSFQPVDRKPSWTVDLGPGNTPGTVPGPRRFHLNNSAEDPSFLCEWIGAGVFEEAGIPTPRIRHAQVWLNGRPLGLYVFKEGWTDDWLQRSGLNAGRIYEPEPGSDMDGDFERKTGDTRDEPADRELLTSLSGWLRSPGGPAAAVPPPRALDVDEFLTFQAVEILLAHRDGYCMARNNYRLLVSSTDHQVRFLPHGMDQLFLPPDLPWNPQRSGAVARALGDDPRHGERCRVLFQRHLQPT